MRHPDLADRKRICLLVVDLQESLRRAVAEADRTVENCARLAAGARILGVPALVTTQYAARLGATVPQVAEALGEFEPLDKMTFSCCGAPGFLGRLAGLGRDTLVVCGVEAHVCVLQTALDLLGHGYRVHVVADAVASRAPENRVLALERMRAAGAVVSSTEMVLFELLREAGTPEFRAVQALVK